MRSDLDETVEIDFDEVRRDEKTELAVLLCLERGERGEPGMEDNVVELPLWWAEQKGLM